MFFVQIILFITVLISSIESSKIVFIECNQTISQNQFVVQSIGYPEGYSGNLSCEYTLKGHANCQTEFHIQFLDFDLERSSNCSKDRLEVTDNENLCGFLSGVRIYKTRINSLRLKFISDEFISGRGFKLLITRLPCSRSNNLISNTRKTSVNILKLSNCCADSYNSRRFYLASPGFPHSNQQPTDCHYLIYRANPNICRLRIHFKYFYEGVELGEHCDNGFLEIDGKQICGCRTGLDVISEFDQRWELNPKIIRYKNTRYSKSNFNGFVLEVIQDECPKKYSSFADMNSTNIIKRSNENQNNSKPIVTIDYYYFNNPEEIQNTSTFKTKQTRSLSQPINKDSINLNTNDDMICQNWGYSQWNLLNKDVLWQKMPQCTVTQYLVPKCYDIRQYRGFLHNPGYPFFYYNNLDCCYRFHKVDGYCGYNVWVMDFNLEVSPDCRKDALILKNKYKYCGNDLLHTKFIMDLQNHHYEDIKFITDDCYCGRGFKLYYEQIPCEYTTPHVTTVTSPPPTQPSCGGQITSEYFDINFFTSHKECIYKIYRVDQDVCGLLLEFVNFDLSCATEYVQINSILKCGNFTGENTFTLFDHRNTVTVSYQRRNKQSFRIFNVILRGRQLRGNECDPFILDVPAERILRKD